MSFPTNDRILQVRKALKISQTDFGKCIGVGRGVINNIDLSLVEAKPLLIDQICKTYNVNKNWLLTGDGDMFNALTLDEELMQIFKQAFADDADPRRKRVIKSIVEMLRNVPDDALPIIGDYAQRLADAIRGDDGANADVDGANADAKK